MNSVLSAIFHSRLRPFASSRSPSPDDPRRWVCEKEIGRRPAELPLTYTLHWPLSPLHRIRKGPRAVKTIKIGVIGTGGISNAHMGGYKQLHDVEVVAGADI